MNLEAGRIQDSSAGRRLSQMWRPSRRVLRARMIATLVSIDTLCILASFLAGGAIYSGFFGGVIDEQWLVLAAVMIPIYLGVAANAQAYSIEIFGARGRGVSKAIRSLLMSIAVMTLVAFFLKAGMIFSRGTFGIASVIALVTIIVARMAFLRHAREMLGGNVYSTVLISDGATLPASGSFSAYIAADSWLDPENDCPIMYDRLATSLREADRVVIACSPERRQAWVQALKGANVRSEVVAPELADLAPMGLSYWDDTPTIVVADGPLSGADAIVKRLFDISVSGLALLALAPVLAIVALLIKLGSAGPVFFVQTRIGLGNRMFRMFKFRSMRVETCDSDGKQSTARDDDRITRIGAFIRQTSIDELPQLINVLLGDMSIVGPRPHALGSRAADKLFWEVDARYWHRHAAKPGLTGLAQVRGFRGATELEQDLTKRLYADLEYLHQWSIWKDLMIIAQTFRVLVHRNAF